MLKRADTRGLGHGKQTGSHLRRGGVARGGEMYLADHNVMPCVRDQATKMGVIVAGAAKKAACVTEHGEVLLRRTSSMNAGDGSHGQKRSPRL